jgi:hypothetical protein
MVQRAIRIFDPHPNSCTRSSKEGKNFSENPQEKFGHGDIICTRNPAQQFLFGPRFPGATTNFSRGEFNADERQEG